MGVDRRSLLRAALAGGVCAVAGPRLLVAQPQPRVIPVTAKRYTYDPDEIALKLNEPVVFRLTSADVVMGFSVPNFGVRATIVPGQVTELALTPTKTGEFTFLCDVFCGSGHEDMDGKLRVVG